MINKGNTNDNREKSSGSSKIKMIDLHCHVLPGMDDGCKTVEESIKVLEEDVRQGVIAVACTSHYYPKESIEAFLERRQRAYKELMTEVKSREIRIPKLCLGAEVAYRDGIAKDPDLVKLCYGSSRYLLLELPFAKWSSLVMRELQIMTRVRGLTPVIAHLERYMKYQDRETLEALYDLDILVQMNAAYYLDFMSSGKARHMIKEGIVSVVGSDSHDSVRRPPNMGLFAEKMMKKGMQEELAEIYGQSKDIFMEALGK